MRATLFWNKTTDIYPKFQKRSSLFWFFCVYRDCNTWSNENRINWQLYYAVNTHQHWLELRGEDGSADGLWSSTYEVVTVSGSKFSRAVALFAACLLTPLSLGTVLSDPQDDPLGPRCSSAAAPAPLHSQSRWPSVRGAHSCSRPSSRWSTGRRRGGRLGAQLNQGGLGVSRWLLWLSPGADGRPWWSVSAPLSLRWVSRWETFHFWVYDVQFGDKCKIFLHYLTQQDLVFILTQKCCRTSALLWPPHVRYRPPVEVTVHFQAPSTRPGYTHEWDVTFVSQTRWSASRNLLYWSIAQHDPYVMLCFPQGTLLFLVLATRCQSLTDAARTCSVCLFQKGYGWIEESSEESYFTRSEGVFAICQMDMGIPAMTKCCNQLDMCYDTCGSNKYRCDSKFRWCLHSICSDLKKSLGFVSKVEGQWNLNLFIVPP